MGHQISRFIEILKQQGRETPLRGSKSSVMGSSFVGVRNKPLIEKVFEDKAWHLYDTEDGKNVLSLYEGQTSFDRASAVELANLVGIGDYKYTLEAAWQRLQPGMAPLENVPFVETTNPRTGEKMVFQENGGHKIYRHPIPGSDDPKEQQGMYLNISQDVSTNFTLPQPLDMAAAWDESVGVTPNTLMMLGRGSHFIMTARRSDFVAGDDEYGMYLALVIPYVPNESIQAIWTPTRIVCMNTYRAGVYRAELTAAVPHIPEAKAVISQHMSQIWANGQQAQIAYKESIEQITRAQLDDDRLVAVLEAAYPMADPEDEPEQMPDESKAKYMARLGRWYENNINFPQRSIDAVVQLLNGGGTAINDKGTNLMSVVHAVSELETYRRGKVASAAVDVYTGRRANRIQAAMDKALELSVVANA